MGVTDYLWLAYFIMKELRRKKKVFLPRRELNPGLLGESQVS